MANTYTSTHTGEWFDSILNLVLDSVYPVGSVYISVNSTSPATLFGGTWVQIQDKFLLCAGSTYTAGSTGGNSSATSGGPSNNTSGSTTLAVSQIPAHTHGSKTLTGQARFRDTASGNHDLILSSSGIVSHSHATEWSGTHDKQSITSASNNYYNDLIVTATHEHTSVGGGTGHTHTLSSHTHTTVTMPPYLAVYVWKRTA